MESTNNAFDTSYESEEKPQNGKEIEKTESVKNVIPLFPEGQKVKIPEKPEELVEAVISSNEIFKGLKRGYVEQAVLAIKGLERKLDNEKLTPEDKWDYVYGLLLSRTKTSAKVFNLNDSSESKQAAEEDLDSIIEYGENLSRKIEYIKDSKDDEKINERISKLEENLKDINKYEGEKGVDRIKNKIISQLIYLNPDNPDYQK